MTHTKWPLVKLKDLLNQVLRSEEVIPGKQYDVLGAKLYAKGLYVKLRKNGSQIKAKNLYVVKEGDFVYNRLFAWKGSFAVVPKELDGLYVSNEFPIFKVNETRILRNYLLYFFSKEKTWEEAGYLSMGVTSISRNRLKVEKLLSIEIPLPPLEEQKRIVAKIENLVGNIDKVRQNKIQMEDELQEMLLGTFLSLTKKSQFLKMGEVAPIVRRPVEIDLTTEYPELGIRSFGKGTFHKPPLNGMDVGTKRLFSIEPGDLVFSNVFAWEGGVAVAKPEDIGRFGSHRFITCLPREGKVTASFLWFYFLTNEGLSKLGEASPGGAGRNRTLGLKALEEIMAPVPPLKDQLWFDSLQAGVEGVRRRQEETQRELAQLVPSILDRAFKGEL
jgi:type I restriction enzyme S subunit